MAWVHISDDDLERYHLGMVKAESELAPIEEHLLVCPGCVKRAEEAADYVDAMRAGIIGGNFDLDGTGGAVPDVSGQPARRGKKGLNGP